VVYQGATPIFADVDPDTLLIDPAGIEAKITERTKAIIAVDYAGQPCDYDALREIAARHGLSIIADAAHALGAKYKDAAVGSIADLSTFSLHPVKHITTGEGGMITTNNPELAKRMRIFRNHGITSDHRQRDAVGSWFYEMVDLGFNYRITDFQCALGLSQLKKLSASVEKRREIARYYDEAFDGMPGVKTLATRTEAFHSYHLYVVLFDVEKLMMTHQEIFSALRAEGIGVNVHYIPVHLHPYYRQHFKTDSGMCKVAETAYERMVSLPIFPAMTGEDAKDVLTAVAKIIRSRVD
jgi:perosamine synthetase